VVLKDFPQLKANGGETQLKWGLLLINGLWQFFDDVLNLFFCLLLGLVFNILDLEHFFKLGLSGSDRLPNNFFE
jgi:hypothetical protein